LRLQCQLFPIIIITGNILKTQLFVQTWFDVLVEII